LNRDVRQRFEGVIRRGDLAAFDLLHSSAFELRWVDRLGNDHVVPHGD
jgi:hypothetical protein